MKLKYSQVMRRHNKGKCPVCGEDATNSTYTSLRVTARDKWFRCNVCGSHWFEVLEILSLGIKDKSNRGIEIENDMFSVSHIPEILQAILSQKEMLPVLMGIDDGLDKLIAERLKDVSYE